MEGEVLPIIVIGGGGHAKVLLNILRRLTIYRVLGFVTPDETGTLLDFSWLGNDEQLKEISARYRNVAGAIGIGKINANGRRLAVLQRARNAGLLMPPIVAPTATVAPDVILGDGTVVFDGAIIQPGCVVGIGSIINNGAIVDHDCTLGDDVHIAPGASISGGVTVGNGSMIGVGASCAHGKRIGAACMIGAGSAIVSDCIDPGTYQGVPAKFVQP